MSAEVKKSPTPEAGSDREAPELERAEEAGPEPEEVDWEAEAKKNHELYLRATAELDNVRKRLEREKADVIKYANESLIKDLLGVLDNLERALDHAPDQEAELESVVEGVVLTHKAFWGVLERFGVRPVAAVGEKFDPNYHEAVMQREDVEAEDQTVLEEVQRGYLLYDRLIRPAMVIVSKQPAREEASES